MLVCDATLAVPIPETFCIGKFHFPNILEESNEYEGFPYKSVERRENVMGIPAVAMNSDSDLTERGSDHMGLPGKTEKCWLSFPIETSK